METEKEKRTKRTRAVTAVVTAALLCGCSASPPPGPPERSAQRQPAPVRSPYDEDFWKLWGDGQAEVSEYELRSRTGEKGTATLVFAAGEFSSYTGAEVEPGHGWGAGVFPVMKLNVQKRMPTHSEMTTVFITLAESSGFPAGMANAVDWSSHALAGQSWARLTIAPSTISASVHRRLEGDVQRTLEFQKWTLPTDALPLVARRIAWPRLRLGQRSTAAWLLTELNDTEPLGNARTTLTISQERQTAVVPGGTFRVHVFRSARLDSSLRTWYVEADPPHRIIRWQFSNGEQAGFVSSFRVPVKSLEVPAGPG